jgi:chromosome segregation ATPase
MPTETGQEPTTTPTPEPTGQPDSSGQEPKTFDEAYVKKLRDEAASHRTKTKEVEKTLSQLQEELAKLKGTQEAATKKELEDQGRWKEIAEQNALKLANLEGLPVKLKEYEATITGLLEGQREGLPEAIVELLDAMPSVKQLEWLGKHKAELVKPNGEAEKPKPAGQLASFNPVGQGGNAETDQQRVARVQRQRGQMSSPFESRKQ